MHHSKSSTKKYDLLYKVLVIGETGIGKTALIRCISQPNKMFSSSLMPTIGIDFVNVDVEVDDLTVRLQICKLYFKFKANFTDLSSTGPFDFFTSTKGPVLGTDTAGQERFRTLNVMHFRGTKGVVLAYDITSGASFTQLQYWLKSLKEHRLLEEELILVGNKSDLANKREVPVSQGEKLAKHHGVSFFETSAKTKANVEKTFQELAKNIKYANNPYQLGSQDAGSDFDMLDGIILPFKHEPHYTSTVRSSLYCCYS